jgi:hypothetical protein
MNPMSNLSLRQAFFAKYGPPDRRIKNIEKAIVFRVDECQLQIGADKKPLSHVCLIFVDTEVQSQITVELRGNVPMGASVQQWIGQAGAHYNGTAWPATALSFPLQRGEQDKLSGLAQAIRAIVAPGKSYSTASYKYTCPRTANALEALRMFLDHAWVA